MRYFQCGRGDRSSGFGVVKAEYRGCWVEGSGGRSRGGSAGRSGGIYGVRVWVQGEGEWMLMSRWWKT